MFKFTTLIFLTLLFVQNAIGQGSGNTLDFDGDGDYVNIPDDSSLNPSGDFSAEVWFKSRSLSNWQGVVTKLTNVNSHTGDGWNIQIGTAQNIATLMSDDSGDYVYLKTSWAPETDVWYHVVFVHKTGTDENFLYVNGKLEATNTHAISFTNNPMQVGKFYTNASNLVFDGQIDEFRYWDKALSESDIRDNMCQKVSTTGSNLIAYYKFDQTATTTLTDLTTNDNDGTLTNMDSNSDWITSSAPIGDVSVHSYPAGANWAGVTLDLTSSDKGNLEVSDVNGSPDGIHIYQVKEKPNTENGIDQDLGTNNIYYGTFIVNGTTPTYTVGYNYENYADAKNEEDNLVLYSRGDNEKSPWADFSATLDKVNSTLTKTSVAERREFVINNKLAPLPVELVYFTAKKKKQRNIMLTWATASEKNNDYFLVQQSRDGINWTNLTKIKGAGDNVTLKSYSYLDVPTFSGTIYYRLQQIDLNGDKSYSKIASVLIDSADSGITIFPNPVSTELTIKTNAAVQVINISLYDRFGKIVYRGIEADNKIDVSQFPAGMYFLEIESNRTKTVNKIIIR